MSAKARFDPAAVIPAQPLMLIDGGWRPAADGSMFADVDPTTGRVLTEVPAGRPADVDVAVTAARTAFDDARWRGLRPEARGAVLHRVGELIDQHAEELARLDVLDIGKPIKYARQDVRGSAEVFRYYAGWPTKVFGETNPTDGRLFAYTLREPVGVCAGIIPWNFPFQMAAWKVAPAIAFGNSIVLKPAEQSPLSALRLGELCLEAGVPPGVVNVVTGLGHEAGAALAAHHDVDKVAFTGSTEVGRQIVHASEGNLKRVSLELGGKSPSIVLPDADLGRAARGAMLGVFLNSGQVCTAGTRILVHRGIHDEFVDRLLSLTGDLVLGDPQDDATDLGPTVSEEQMERVLGYIDAGTSEGASLAAGGRRASGLGDGLSEGYFVEPTVFLGVDNAMRIAREEIFGPVASVIAVGDVDQAIAVGNETMYGLSATVWTRDLDAAHRVARGLRAGTVWVNTTNLVDPSISFGGLRQSGFGRELGKHSIDLYTDTKSVWVRLG